MRNCVAEKGQMLVDGCNWEDGARVVRWTTGEVRCRGSREKNNVVNLARFAWFAMFTPD